MLEELHHSTTYISVTALNGSFSGDCLCYAIFTENVSTLYIKYRGWVDTTLKLGANFNIMVFVDDLTEQLYFNVISFSHQYKLLVKSNAHKS